MKALVGAFNQEKALVGAFSVIVKTDYETDGSFYSTTENGSPSDDRLSVPLSRPVSIHEPPGRCSLHQIGVKTSSDWRHSQLVIS